MTGRELATLNGHEDTVYCCCFSPDGSQIVSASEDQTVKLWDAATGRELATLGNDDRVLACAFSPDARRIISNGVVLSVWDVQQRRLLARLEALSEMKSLSALVEGPGRYRRLTELLQGRSESFAISADARFIAWASWDRRLILSNSETGRTVGEFYLRGRGTAVGWSPVAGIVAGTEAGAVYLLRPEGFSFDPAIATGIRIGRTNRSFWHRRQELIRTRCTFCAKPLELPDSALGNEMDCEHCGRRLKLNPFVVDDA